MNIHRISRMRQKHQLERHTHLWYLALNWSRKKNNAPGLPLECTRRPHARSHFLGKGGYFWAV